MVNKVFQISLKSNFYSKFLLVFILILVFLSPFNHKELFFIYRWNLFPARIFLAFTLFFGIFLIRRRFLDPLFYLLFSMSTVIFLSSFKSSNYFESLLYSLFYFTFPFLYLILKYLFLIYKNKFVAYFLFVYLLSGLLSSLFQFVQIKLFYQSGYLFGAVWPLKDSVPRFGSLFWDVNHFAVFMVISIWVGLILLLLAFNIKSSKKKAFLISSTFLIIFALVVFFLSLYFSFSRSAFLGLIIGLVIIFLIFIYMRSIWHKFLDLILIPLSAFLVFMYFTPFNFFSPLRSLFVYRSESLFSHFKLLFLGFDLFLKSPILGVGVGNFSKAVHKHPKFLELSFLDPSVLQDNLPIHSIWFQFLVESGVFAFFLFFILASFSFYGLLKKYRETKKLFYLVILGSLASIFTSGIFYSYNMEFFWLYFLFILSFTFYSFDFNKNIFFRFKSFLLSWRFFLFFLGGISFIWSLFMYLSLLPSLREIQTFNFAKTYSTIPHFSLGNFYFIFLRKFQYIFGYYPYVGRLVSLIFAASSLLLLYNSFKKLIHFSRFSIVTSIFIISLFSVLRFFDISILSFYLFLCCLIFYIFSSAFTLFSSKKINFSWDFRPLLILAFILFSLSYNPYLFKPYLPNVSYLANLFSQRYSLMDFYVFSPIENSPEVLSFYTEPSFKITSRFSESIKGKPYVFFTKDKNIPYHYHVKLKHNNTYLFVNFSKKGK